MLFLVCISSVTLVVQKVEASGTIYIRADGSIDPPTAPIQRDGETYVFTDDVYEPIVVERDNIVVDGERYTIQGTGVPFVEGILMNERKNVSISRIEISAFDYGINLFNCSAIIISENNIRNGRDGLIFSASSNNMISGNNIIDFDNCGIQLDDYSNNNTIQKNNVTNCSFVGLQVDGGVAQHSDNNTISENNITSNNNSGIYIVGCYNNVVHDNNVGNNTLYGISIYSSSNNTVSGNNVRDNEIGIQLRGSSNNNIVYGNIMTRNSYGIYLEGLLFGGDGPSDNFLYHNDFINNTQQVYPIDSGYANSWDDGHPLGGNYWSDYNGTDTNHDGIGDTPYIIDANNTDHYPLMSPYIIPEFPSFLILPLFFLATLLAVLVHRRKHRGLFKK